MRVSAATSNWQTQLNCDFGKLWIAFSSHTALINLVDPCSGQINEEHDLIISDFLSSQAQFMNSLHSIFMIISIRMRYWMIHLLFCASELWTGIHYVNNIIQEESTMRVVRIEFCHRSVSEKGLFFLGKSDKRHKNLHHFYSKSRLVLAIKKNCKALYHLFFLTSQVILDAYIIIDKNWWIINIQNRTFKASQHHVG